MSGQFLITGGAGFIGSHVAEALLGRGDQVVVLDNFNDFYDPKLKRANAALVQQAGGEVVEGDIRDGDLVKKLIVERGFDGVIHLAAMAGVRPSLDDPLLYQDVNLRGTTLILEALQQRPATRLVFASSSSVYGGNEKVPFHEDDDVSYPVSPYAATKRAGELICWTFHHLYSIPTTCLRFFTVYGPRQRPEMAIHRFVRCVHEGQPIPFFGDGSSRRDYTFVSDIVGGVVQALDQCGSYAIYNLGESATTTLSELVTQIGEACGQEPLLNRLPQQPGDVPVTFADISRARKELGYDPQVPVAQGLKCFVEWYRSQAPGT